MGRIGADAPVAEAALDRPSSTACSRSCASPASSRRRPHRNAAPAAGGRPRVLVVEDNPDMNRFVAECLSRDYDVVTAFDGREGLEQALRFDPMVIVSDIMMPHVSGVEMVAADAGAPGAAAHADPAALGQGRRGADGAAPRRRRPGLHRQAVLGARPARPRPQPRARRASARAAAESANRAKDEFLAMLGHELRNPLSPILTALQLMKLRGEPGSERERTVIERQVSHLTRLVDDLLDVSRIARGRVELKTEIVEIAEVVAKAIEMASPLLEQRNHTLKVDVPRRGLRVDGDPTRLGQVISNLLTNAAKYTPPNGVVTVRAQQVDDEVVLSVRDTGIGIAPEVLPRIFDLFVQERQALDRSQGGLGIGLTIVRSLIERHGGSVSARSDGPGQGQRVHRPPAARQDGPMPAPMRCRRRARRPRPRRAPVPCASSSSTTTRTAPRCWPTRSIGKGYDTRVAHDAPAALRVAAEFSPDVAFLDIGLPVMDGYELAAHLRELPGLAGLRLIAVTGYGQESDRRRTRDAGFHGHLVKPVDLDAIEATLKPASS